MAMGSGSNAGIIRVMRTFIPRNRNCVLGCYILVLSPMLCFLFSQVDIGFQEATESVGLRSLRNIRDVQNGSVWAKLGHPQTERQVPTFKCTENGSLRDIPEKIPAPHRLFLQYKHCRAFPALLTPRDCEPDLFLLLAIKSTAAQIDRRMALRNTWGQERTIMGKRVRLVFLLGRSQDIVRGYPLQRLLEYENSRFGDILQWDFADTFFNLTLKEVHFLEWFSRECQAAQFVMKGDDDVFVNTENLLEFLQDKSPSDHLFIGDLIDMAKPIRHPKSKYFVPVEMYPSKQYPPYPGGGGYLMSRQTVIGLNLAAQGTDMFPIDDVFVGMCLQKMNVKVVFHDGFKTVGYRQRITPFHPCIYKDLMLVHKLNPTEMWNMWALVKDPNLMCSIKSIKM